MNSLLRKRFASASASVVANAFEHVPYVAPDSILTMTKKFNANPAEEKINLGIGCYRDDEGLPYVYPVVRKVESEIANDHSLDKEYLPIEGCADFNRAARKVAFGPALAQLFENRIGSC